MRTPSLPALPDIGHENAKAVFSHPSLGLTPKRARKDDKIAENYRRLSFLGDSILSIVITDYLYDNYSLYRTGVYHAERVKFSNNCQLAEWSTQYGLMERLRHKGPDRVISTSTKVRASVFEAYVGAVYKEVGLDGVKAWLEELIGPRVTIAEDDR